MIAIRVLTERAARFGGMLLALFLLTYLGRRMPVNATTAGFCYLLSVLLVATFGTLPEAIFVSVAAALCLNYFFLPPLFRFTIADPQDWAALVVFLITAVMVSHLSSTARTERRGALQRSQEMERLYTLSRSILLQPASEPAIRNLSLQIARVFNSTAALFERETDQIYRAGSLDLPEWDDRLRAAALAGTQFRDDETLTVVTSIRLGADVIGSLLLRGQHLSDSALQSLANLMAIAIERARLLESTNAAEAIRKSEELKSTLLDAIAHEFKTPLTSIKAAASALRSGVADASAQQEFVQIIDEECDRLKRLVTDAIQMARIESGKLHLERRRSSVTDLIAGAVNSFGALAEGRDQVHISDPRLEVNADPGLMQLALKQLLDNALKYSPPGSPVTIAAQKREGNVLISVSNKGDGLSPSEQRRVFDRYYRSPATREQAPGTGIGLAVAKEIMLAHGGRIWVESEAGRGAQFFLLLPSDGEGRAG